MMVICPVVFRILTPDENVRILAAQVLRIGLLAEPLYGVSIVAAGALRGTGDTLVPSLMNLVSIWVVRLGLAVLLVGNLGLAWHVDCHGGGTMCPWTSDAVPAENIEIL